MDYAIYPSLVKKLGINYWEPTYILFPFRIEKICVNYGLLQST